MNNQFQRLELMINDDINKLQDNTVLIVGIGGVGSFATETLARCGIKRLILIDKDIVDVTNLNRQLIALHSTLNQPKVEVMKKRILDINPECEVITHQEFLSKDNIDDIVINEIDFVIDACDTIETKFLIMQHCLIKKIKFVSSMGAANKMDNTMVEVIDLSKTYNDPIAKVLRMKVKKAKIKGKIPVVFSSEVPTKPKNDNLDLNVKSRKELPLLGSNAFVPSTFGITCANYCFRQLINKK